MRKMSKLMVGLGALFYSGVAFEQLPDPAPSAQVPLGEGPPSEALPPPRSDHDPRPPVPAPTVPRTGVTQQAGIGGTQAYARAGVLELGGSAGWAAASNFTRFELSPSFGVFLVDNVELSLLTALNYFRIGAIENNPSSSAT